MAFPGSTPNILNGVLSRRSAIPENSSSGVKTPFYFEEKAIGRLFMMNFVVTEWVVNECVAFKMTSGNIVKGYEQRYTITGIPSGSQFTCFEDVKMPYGVAGRAAGLLRRFVSEGRLER